MKKMSGLFIAAGALASVISAQKMTLEGKGNTLTTGDMIDGAGHIPFTTGVVEISSLEITVRSGGPKQKVNSNTDSLGINSDVANNSTERFEYGESMFVWFNKDLKITQFNFNHFNQDEVFHIKIGNMPEFMLFHTDLSNKREDYLYTNLFVSAGTQIELSVGNTNSSIGLDSISLVVSEGTESFLLPPVPIENP